MRLWRGCVGMVLAVSAVAAAQTSGPAAGAEEAPLGLAEIDETMNALIRQLPTTSVRAPELTAAQRETSEKARAFYKRAVAQADGLDGETRLNLTLIGIRAGFGTGDAEMMLSAARQRWQLEQAGKGVTDYSAYVLSWAGIFAGDSKAALEGLQRLARHSTDPGLKAWARGMGPVAAQAGKIVKASLRLLDGKVLALPDPAGRVVVLSFWSSHSVAAVREVAELKDFHEKRRADKSFMLVGVSLDRTEADARGRIASHGMTWPQAMDRGLRRRFAGSGVPHAVVLSAKGHILWQGHPALKETLVRTTDFALRQARLTAREKPPTTRPRPSGPPAVEKPPPKSPKPTEAEEAAAENKYKMARIYLKMRMATKAKAGLQEVIRQYPGTRAAAKARSDLRFIR